MKKFLAVLLSLCMVLTCMIPMLCAEETDAEETHEANTIRINASELTGGKLTETPETMWVATLTGKQSVGAMQLQWASKNATAEDVPTFDITGMDFFEIQMYISNVELFKTDVNFCFELGSGGANDVDEDQMINTWGKILSEAGVTLEDGWNTIRIPLSMWPKGGANRAKINAFRFFLNGDMEIPEGEKLELYIRSVGFGKGDEVQSIPLISENGVQGSFSYYDYPSTRTWTMTAGQDVGAAKGFVTQWTGDAMDLTTYKYVDLRVKLSNHDALKKVKFEVELASSGTCDKNENNYTGYLTDLHEGWGTIRIPLTAFNIESGGKADFSAINWFRIYTNTGVVDTDTSFELAYVEFSDAGDVNFVDYTIYCGASAEEMPEGVTVISNTAAMGHKDIIYTDANAEWVIEINLQNIDPSFIYMSADLRGKNMLLQVSEKNDANSWVNMVDEENPLVTNGNYVINIGQYLSMAKFKPAGYKLYLRLADYSPEDGNGGQIAKATPIIFSVGYSDWKVDETYVEITDEMMQMDIDEMKRTEHSVPLFGCSAEIGGFTLDYKDYKNGCSSLSIKLGTYIDKNGDKVTVNGQSGFKFTTSEYAGEDTIDASGMDTLEFWLYVSDIEALRAINFGDTALELTSAGRADAEETNWKLPTILEQVTENGWNPIRLTFGSGGHTGETDWSRLNFLRFFFVNGSNLPEGDPVVIKIDDIRLTDYEAQQKELQKPVAEAMGKKIEETLGEIPEFDKTNADVVAQYKANRDTWKAAYDAIKEEYDALDSIAQGLVTDGGQKAVMTKVGRWITNFDKYLQNEANNKEDENKGENQGGENQGNENQGSENQGNENQGGENTEKPDDTNKPDDKTDDTKEDGGNATVVIVIVVVVVVIAAAAVAVFFVLKKKKNA